MKFFKDVVRAVRSKSTLGRVQEASLYAEVVTELEHGKKDIGLWGKALAESNGDERTAQARYLKLRVIALKDALQLQADVQASVAEEMERREKEREKSERKAADEHYDQEWPTNLEPDDSDENPFDDPDDSEGWGGVALFIIIFGVVIIALVAGYI